MSPDDAAPSYDALITPETRLGSEELVEKAPKADRRFHSVTTILNSMDKPALLYWSAEQAALAAVRIADSLPYRLREEGTDEVVKWLRDARFRPLPGKRTAAALGTANHEAFDFFAHHGTLPDGLDDEVLPFAKQFERFAEVWQPRYLAAETAIYNRRYGFAGTLDAIVEIDGQLWILDYKTSPKSIGSDGKPSHPWPEAALQLAAYRNADLIAYFRVRRWEYFRRRYYLLSTEEEELGEPMPEVAGCLVLHITPDHADLYPVKADEEMFHYFLNVTEVFRFQQDAAKRAFGLPFSSIRKEG